MYRTLAAGNRLVFLEMATAISEFVNLFGAGQGASTMDDSGGTDVESSASDRPPPSEAPEARSHWRLWPLFRERSRGSQVDSADGGSTPAGPPSDFDRYWSWMVVFLGELNRSDASWLAMGDPPDPTPMKKGLYSYYLARLALDPNKKAQLVLQGNLYLISYEQRRLDHFLHVTLSPFTTYWLERLLRGHWHARRVRRRRRVLGPITTPYAMAITRFFLYLELPPDQELRVGAPVPPVLPGDPTLRFPAVLRQITLPELQALLTMYDRSEREYDQTGAGNWSRYHDRMNYITTLFRSRQRDVRLFEDPWDEQEAQTLRSGHLYHHRRK